MCVSEGKEGRKEENMLCILLSNKQEKKRRNKITTVVLLLLMEEKQKQAVCMCFLGGTDNPKIALEKKDLGTGTSGDRHNIVSLEGPPLLEDRTGDRKRQGRRTPGYCEGRRKEETEKFWRRKAEDLFIGGVPCLVIINCYYD